MFTSSFCTLICRKVLMTSTTCDFHSHYICTLLLLFSQNKETSFLIWFLVSMHGFQSRQQKCVPRRLWIVLAVETCTWLSHLGWRCGVGSKSFVLKYLNGVHTQCMSIGHALQRKTPSSNIWCFKTTNSSTGLKFNP